METSSRDSSRAGNFAMIIHATGPYDSDDSDAGDADRILTQFTTQLDDAGHTIRSVTLVTGSRIRNAVRDRSGGYVLAEAPESIPEQGLDPAVLDPAAVQAEHDRAVAEHDAAFRDREAPAARPGEAAREREGNPRYAAAEAAREREADPRYPAGDVAPGEYATDEASRRALAEDTSRRESAGDSPDAPRVIP